MFYKLWKTPGERGRERAPRLFICVGMAFLLKKQAALGPRCFTKVKQRLAGAFTGAMPNGTDPRERLAFAVSVHNELTLYLKGYKVKKPFAPLHPIGTIAFPHLADKRRRCLDWIWGELYAQGCGNP